jgi:chromosome segregation ATPase
LEQFLAGYPKAVKAQSEGAPTSPEPSGEEATSGPAQHHSRRNLHQRAPSLTDFDVATLAKLGQSLEELQGENLRLTGQIEIQTEQIRAAAEGHLAYTQEIERLQKLLDEADMTHSRLNDQLKQRQDSLTATSKDLSALQEQYDAVHALLKESQSASSSAQQEIEELNKRIRKLDTVLKDAEADFQARLTAALKEKDSKIEQLTKDIDTASKANGHSTEITNLKFQLDQLQHKYDLRKKQVEELRLNENFYEEENKRLQQELDNLQSSLSPSSGKLASERGVRSKVLERSTSLGKPAVASLKHERGVSTPLASGGVVMKPVISVTPSTPVNLKRSKSGSNPSQMAAIPLNLPGASTGHSPRSESSDGNGVISGGGSLSPSSSFSNLSASGSSTAPKSTPALMNLASSTPSSSSTTNPSTSSAKRARRLSGSLTDDLEIAAPHFAKALSKQYLGDKKERPGDDDVEPLAGLSTGPNSARSSMEIPSPRVLEENLQLQAQIDNLKALVTKLEFDVQKHKHSESDMLGKLSDLEAENSDLKEKEAQLNAELHKKDILYRETAAESDSLQKRSSESALKFTQDLERLKRQLKDEQARLQELEATCNDFRDSNLNLERQYSELLSKYNSLEEESIEKGNKLKHVHAALEAQKTMISQLSSVATSKEDSLNDELETLRRQLAESKDASKSFEESGEATRDELSKAQASMTTLAQKLQNAENGLRQQQVLQGKLAELENEKQMWDRANSDFAATVHTQKQTIIVLQQKIADMELQLSQHTSKVQETEGSSSAALKEAQSKIESLTQQLSDQMETAAQLSDSQASLQRITESFNNLELEKKALEQQLETVKSQHSKFSAAVELERSSQASRVQELEEVILQLKKESEAALDDLNKKMTAAIETERSSKATQIEELTNTIRRMKEESEVRSASEQQLEASNTESRRVADSLQKLVADLNEQLKQKDSTLEEAMRQVELVQQDTEVVKADGAKRVFDLESERAKQAEYIEGLERKIESLKEELTTSQSSLLKQLETTSLESRQLEESSKLVISQRKLLLRRPSVKLNMSDMNWRRSRLRARRFPRSKLTQSSSSLTSKRNSNPRLLQ